MQLSATTEKVAAVVLPPTSEDTADEDDDEVQAMMSSSPFGVGRGMVSLLSIISTSCAFAKCFTNPPHQ